MKASIFTKIYIILSLFPIYAIGKIDGNDETSQNVPEKVENLLHNVVNVYIKNCKDHAGVLKLAKGNDGEFSVLIDAARFCRAQRDIMDCFEMHKDDTYNALLKEYNLQDDIFYKAGRPIACRILRAANVWSVQTKDNSLIEQLSGENMTENVKSVRKWNGISLNENSAKESISREVVEKKRSEEASSEQIKSKENASSGFVSMEFSSWAKFFLYFETLKFALLQKDNPNPVANQTSQICNKVDNERLTLRKYQNLSGFTKINLKIKELKRKAEESLAYKANHVETDCLLRLVELRAFLEFSLSLIKSVCNRNVKDEKFLEISGGQCKLYHVRTDAELREKVVDSNEVLMDRIGQAFQEQGLMDWWTEFKTEWITGKMIARIKDLPVKNVSRQAKTVTFVDFHGDNHKAPGKFDITISIERAAQFYEQMEKLREFVWQFSTLLETCQHIYANKKAFDVFEQIIGFPEFAALFERMQKDAKEVLEIPEYNVQDRKSPDNLIYDVIRIRVLIELFRSLLFVLAISNNKAAKSAILCNSALKRHICNEDEKDLKMLDNLKNNYNNWAAKMDDWFSEEQLMKPGKRLLDKWKQIFERKWILRNIHMNIEGMQLEDGQPSKRPTVLIKNSEIPPEFYKLKPQKEIVRNEGEMMRNAEIDFSDEGILDEKDNDNDTAIGNVDEVDDKTLEEPPRLFTIPFRPLTNVENVEEMRTNSQSSTSGKYFITDMEASDRNDTVDNSDSKYEFVRYATI